MEKFKMLVVDDKAGLSGDHSQATEGEKDEVTGVGQRLQSLGIFDSHEVDVTILDVKMPGWTD